MKGASAPFVTAFLLSFAILFCHSCPSGYYGSDPQCTPCPVNTYKDVSGDAQACTPCPPYSDNPLIGGSSITDCQCATGYERQGQDCVDIQPPVFEFCSSSPTIITSPQKGSATAEMFWTVEVTDNSVGVDPRAVVKVRSNYEAPHKFPLGIHHVEVNATDSTGNVAFCAFLINVRDTEAPTCSFCPSDIVIDDATFVQMRVNWDRPICSDNSGQPALVEANRFSGSIFGVPGIYQVLYKISDGYGNNYDGCSFLITLEKKTCPLYAPPKNGALTCFDNGGDLSCIAMCKNGYDFVFDSPLLYFCSQGTWHFFSFGPYVTTLPWPDCSDTANPSWLSQTRLPGFFFDGDDPNVQDVLRDNFLLVMRSSFMIPFFCQDNPQCTKDNVLVYIGEVV